MRKINLVGKRFGKLIIIEKDIIRSKIKSSFWFCQCDCGNIKSCFGSNLTSGKTSSCGCYRKKVTSERCKGRTAVNRLEPGMGSMHYLYNQYKQTAKARNLEFSLNYDEFKELTSDNCFYCNTIPNKEIKGPRSFGVYQHNGVDRVDSFIGYINGNCVSCCEDCNRAKWEMGFSEFLLYIERLSNALKNKGWINVEP